MKLFLSLFCGLLLSFTSSAQTLEVNYIEPTQKLTQGLDLKFKGEKLIFSWRKVGDLHIAVFQMGESYRYGALDANGRWREAGTQVQPSEIPEAITKALPELDMTAFLVEVFQATTYNDEKGYFFLYETERFRQEFWVDQSGKMLRQAKYLIPKEKEEAEEEATEEEWK